MDTAKNYDTEILDFLSFIKKYFPVYQVDTDNQKVIKDLNLWANRDLSFNGREPGWHIDRGILLSGPVGVGKDELFRMLRKYISYIRSPYGYDSKVIWEYAKPFEKDGYLCFNDGIGNRYYEELALTDDTTGAPVREMVNHFGNKILIGAEIINLRDKVFKEQGYMTHYSTNHNEEGLLKVYGTRCMSRLYEQCNLMFLKGKDRRGIVAPTFLKNRNQPSAPAARETTVDEHMENHRILESEYSQFCDKGTTTMNVSLNYNLLKIYGCSLGTDEDMRIFIKLAAASYIEDTGLKRLTLIERENNKRVYSWALARKMAVEKFYATLKLAGAKTIFKIVDVNVGALVKEALHKI